MNRLFKTFLLLGAASLGAAIGLATLVNVKPELSAAQPVRIAGAMAKPLAQKLQGKPVVVDIYASWCPGCKNIAPTLSNLKQQYQGKANFVVFDVSDRETTQMAEAKAKQLGLSDFLMANKTQTSMVAIIDPATGKVLKQFRNNPNQEDYVAVLNRAIAQIQK
ncbi:MAG: redoxin family protein [Aphanocapsa sp. GSE-SYN-MK-11-07L]|jgi:thiol-disulfide isomerase/thioredoxin|nr:redoxin family protein [Aphanocapsa sp. GSE-SYN-MK-11-07L]